MRCDCGRGIERWNDVVGCESKAEYGVEDVVVDEVRGRGGLMLLILLKTSRRCMSNALAEASVRRGGCMREM